MHPNFRNFALWVIIFLLVVALVMLFYNPSQRTAAQDSISFSEFLSDVQGGQVREVTIVGNEVSGHLKNDKAFETYTPNDPSLVQSLVKNGVTINAKPPSDGNSWLLTLLINACRYLPLSACGFSSPGRCKGLAAKRSVRQIQGETAHRSARAHHF